MIHNKDDYLYISITTLNSSFTPLKPSAEVTNYEVFIIAFVMCVALSFVYLFFVEWFGKVLIYICVAVLAVAPAAMGSYCLYQAVQGQESDYGKQVASFNLGVTGTQGDMILGAAGASKNREANGRCSIRFSLILLGFA